jgi:DNA-damage-inducible protein D
MNDNNELTNQLVPGSHISPFERIRRLSEDGGEYWSARDLAKVLGYDDYRNFLNVVEKARVACENSGQDPQDHIVDVTDMIEVGKGARRKVADAYLSRYASYLVVQNADPAKEIVALGQTYFAVQTRRQEQAGEWAGLTRDQRRLELREQIAVHNRHLASAAQQAGVVQSIDFAVFQDHGYKGLYGGLRAQDIHVRKELKKNQHILDHMGSEELAANLFRVTQTEAKLERERIQGKERANKTHYEVGEKVRQTIQELGGTMPEKLPTPPESIQQVRQKEHRRLKQSRRLPMLARPQTRADE